MNYIFCLRDTLNRIFSALRALSAMKFKYPTIYAMTHKAHHTHPRILLYILQYIQMRYGAMQRKTSSNIFSSRNWIIVMVHLFFVQMCAETGRNIFLSLYQEQSQSKPDLISNIHYTTCCILVCASGRTKFMLKIDFKIMHARVCSSNKMTIMQLQPKQKRKKTAAGKSVITCTVFHI